MRRAAETERKSQHVRTAWLNSGRNHCSNEHRREYSRKLGLRRSDESVLASGAPGCSSGVDGVVASPQEIKAIRSTVPKPDFLVVTPGIRPSFIDDAQHRRSETSRHSSHRPGCWRVLSCRRPTDHWRARPGRSRTRDRRRDGSADVVMKGTDNGDVACNMSSRTYFSICPAFVLNLSCDGESQFETPVIPHLTILFLAFIFPVFAQEKDGGTCASLLAGAL